MEFDFKQDHFALFGLPQTFDVSADALEAAYRDWQARVHPDRFAHASEAEKRASMQWATHVNEAYQTLKQPVARGRYMLGLHGVDTQEESNTAMAPAFLMQQMEWREALMDAKMASDIDALEQLEKELRQEMRARSSSLGQTIDVAKDYNRAAEQVRELRFVEKLLQEINQAYDALDA